LGHISFIKGFKVFSIDYKIVFIGDQLAENSLVFGFGAPAVSFRLIENFIIFTFSAYENEKMLSTDNIEKILKLLKDLYLVNT